MTSRQIAKILRTPNHFLVWLHQKREYHFRYPNTIRAAYGESLGIELHKRSWWHIGANTCYDTPEWWQKLANTELCVFGTEPVEVYNLLMEQITHAAA